MTEAKHTPGPWFVTGIRTLYVEARIGGGLVQEVAACGPTLQDGGYGDQQKANARLISAAPELLEALRVVAAALAWQCHGDCRAFGDDPILPTQEAIDKATAAIAKATGN